MASKKQTSKLAATSTTGNHFDHQRAYQNIIDYYNIIEKKEQEENNSVLIQKVEKLIKGKSVVLENYVRDSI